MIGTAAVILVPFDIAVRADADVSPEASLRASKAADPIAAAASRSREDMPTPTTGDLGLPGLPDRHASNNATICPAVVGATTVCWAVVGAALCGVPKLRPSFGVYQPQRVTARRLRQARLSLQAMCVGICAIGHRRTPHVETCRYW